MYNLYYFYTLFCITVIFYLSSYFIFTVDNEFCVKSETCCRFITTIYALPFLHPISILIITSLPEVILKNLLTIYKKIKFVSLNRVNILKQKRCDIPRFWLNKPALKFNFDRTVLENRCFMSHSYSKVTHLMLSLFFITMYFS